MPTQPPKPPIEEFFERHLQTVAARLERNTDEALRRQRNAWREALHRQSALDENEAEDISDKR